MALQPVVGCAVAEARHRVLVLGFGTVQLGALQQHRPDAVNVRAVRVIGLLTFGMVLAVDRGPLLGDLAGGQPQPEPEEMPRR